MKINVNVNLKLKSKIIKKKINKRQQEWKRYENQ